MSIYESTNPGIIIPPTTPNLINSVEFCGYLSNHDIKSLIENSQGQILPGCCGIRVYNLVPETRPSPINQIMACGVKGDGFDMIHNYRLSKESSSLRHSEATIFSMRLDARHFAEVNNKALSFSSFFSIAMLNSLFDSSKDGNRLDGLNFYKTSIDWMDDPIIPTHVQSSSNLKTNIVIPVRLNDAIPTKITNSALIPIAIASAHPCPSHCVDIIDSIPRRNDTPHFGGSESTINTDPYLIRW